MIAFLKRFLPHVYVGDKTDTVACAYEQGGMWYEFPLLPSNGDVVHSILFADGSMWDTHNGWRTSPSHTVEYARNYESYIRRRNGQMELWSSRRGWSGHIATEF